MRCMQRGTLRPHTPARAAEADSKEDGTGVAATSARTAPTQHAARHTRQLAADNMQRWDWRRCKQHTRPPHPRSPGRPLTAAWLPARLRR